MTPDSFDSPDGRTYSAPETPAVTPGQAALPPLPPKWTGKFRKRPVVIDAVQLTDDNAAELAAWSGGREASIWQPTDPPVLKARLVIPTLEGDHLALPGDWIIRGVKGEFYPCADDVFRETYEPAETAPDYRALLDKENTRLRGRLQAVKRLAEQGIASGIIDSRALLAETEDL